MDSALNLIMKHQKEICMLESITALLDWDEQTNMPRAAITGRSEQVKYVNGLIHDRLNAPVLSSAIAELKTQQLGERDRAIMAALEKKVKRAKVIPRRFHVDLAQQIMIAQSVWKEARLKNDFSVFLPHLENILAMKKRQATFFDPDAKRYDALLEEHEEGLTMRRLDATFDHLKQGLTSLLSAIQHTERYKTLHPLHLSIPQKVQKMLIKEFLGWMKLPEEKVRLSVSPHPFTTGIAPLDVRITTRYTDTLESFFTAIHEGGHALYEIGLPAKYVNTFIHSQASYGIDESQALFWEYHIAKSRMFWEAYWSLFVEQTGIDIEREAFYCGVNMVRPSFIRVNADEVTYPLHIIFRYEIEKLLIGGELEVRDAKKVWNKMMKEYLNISPRNDNEGILQDIHWATGDFGYFPTYALGNIYAAMIRKQIGKEIKDIDQQIRDLNFTPIIKWLIHRIHRKGKTQPPSTLMRRICGTDLDVKTFLSYLNKKFGEIYSF